MGKSTSWWHNPNIQSALITGVLGLFGTGLTIYATRPPAHIDPNAPTPVAQMHRVDGSPNNIQAQAISIGDSAMIDSSVAPTPAVNHHSTQVAIGQKSSLSNFELRFNFALFQQAASRTGITLAEKNELSRRLSALQVVWQGYYDGWTAHSKPTDQAYFTLSLVERQEKVTQSMFKMPALIRMPRSELEKVKQLRPGQTIRVGGTFDSHSPVATIVTQGRLISSTLESRSNVAKGKATSTTQ